MSYPIMAYYMDLAIVAEETARIANSKSLATFSLIERERNSEQSLLFASEPIEPYMKLMR